MGHGDECVEALCGGRQLEESKIFILPGLGATAPTGFSSWLDAVGNTEDEQGA